MARSGWQRYRMARSASRTRTTSYPHTQAAALASPRAVRRCTLAAIRHDRIPTGSALASSSDTSASLGALAVIAEFIALTVLARWSKAPA